MDLFVLKKEQFDHLSEKDPELLSFLTEIVADRFDSNRPTAYRTIGKYLTTDIIGRGGYSVVYKGLHSLLNMPVAIKMLRHNMAIDKDFLHSFYGEAIIIAGLHHLKEDIPDPAKIVPEIPEVLRKFILKAGRCKPDQRYRNIDRAIEDLHVFVDKLWSGYDTNIQTDKIG
jgi:hypothetical protein